MLLTFGRIEKSDATILHIIGQDATLVSHQGSPFLRSQTIGIGMKDYEDGVGICLRDK